jgi:hypothetical protein
MGRPKKDYSLNRKRKHELKGDSSRPKVLEIHDALDKFPHNDWNDCCGRMQVAIIRNRIPYAKESLEEFIRSYLTPTQLNRHDTPVSDVFPTRLYGYLQDAGYDTLGAVKNAKDHELLAIPNFGPGCLREVRAACLRLDAGFKKLYNPPAMEDVPEPVVVPVERPVQVRSTPVSHVQTDPNAVKKAALDVLINSPKEIAEYAEAEITRLEAAIVKAKEKIANLRRTLRSIDPPAKTPRIGGPKPSRHPSDSFDYDKFFELCRDAIHEAGKITIPDLVKYLRNQDFEITHQGVFRRLVAAPEHATWVREGKYFTKP